MYTVPAKVTIPAKKLIETFEKCGALAENKDGTTPVLNREVSVEELAEPGTARKLLQTFETRTNQTSGDVIKSPAPRGNKLPRDMLSEFQKSDDVKATQLSDTYSNECKNRETEPSFLERTGSLEATASMFQPATDNHSSVTEITTVTEAIQDKDKTNLSTRVESVRNILYIDAVRKKTKVDSKIQQETINRLVSGHCSVRNVDLTQEHKLLKDIDLEEERRKLLTCDLLVLHFQPILHCVPAILQSWMERVLCPLQHVPDCSLLKGKKCLIIMTTDAQESDYAADSRLGDVSRYLLPLQVGVLRYVGFDVLSPMIIYDTNSSSQCAEAADHNSDDTPRACSGRLHNWLTRLDNIWNEIPAMLSH